MPRALLPGPGPPPLLSPAPVHTGAVRRSSRSVLTRAAVALALVGSAASALAASPAAEKRVVRGSDGYLFIAQDWSVPCQHAGEARATVDRMAGFVAAVQKSGRDATVLLAPDKATLRTGNLPKDVPLRSCGEREKAEVRRQMTDRLGADTLDLRHDLANAGARHQVYWRQDTHWTPTGGVVLARRLLMQLDPVLEQRVTTRPSTYTRRGDLADVLGIPGRESAQGLQLVNPGVTATELERGDQGVGQGSRHTVAVPDSGGTGRVVPGKTLFLGDSTAATAIGQLAPLFEDATYLWPDQDVTPQQLLEKVEAADRVVVLRVERFSAEWRPYDADVVRRAVGGAQPAERPRRVAALTSGPWQHAAPALVGAPGRGRAGAPARPAG